MILDALQFPFMQRALFVGILLAALLAVLGVFATLRKMAFFGEGVAHASLAGIAIAILAGVAPLPVAIVWAVLVSLFLYWMERRTRLSSDTLIGVFLTASMALGVVLMTFTQGYQPELVSFLFGNILTITQTDLFVIAGISSLIFLWLTLSFRQLTLLSLNEDLAAVRGIRVNTQTLLFYIALGVATVLGVKILGIILISALLILPSATARLLSHSFRAYFWLALLIGEITIITGLFLSYGLDWPSGATIVLVGTAFLLLATLTNTLSPQK